jgi:hypothetical protein
VGWLLAGICSGLLETLYGFSSVFQWSAYLAIGALLIIFSLKQGVQKYGYDKTTSIG